MEHQIKFFFSRREKFLGWVKNQTSRQHLLYSTYDTNNYAIIINEKYAYRHIFKSGGTTIQFQMRREKQYDRPKEIGNRRLVATVRDPIDHFLNGWAECGSRFFDVMMNLTKSNSTTNAITPTYNDQVAMWLFYQDHSPHKDRLRACGSHSAPQATFLFKSRSEFEWEPKIDIVGDMQEIPGLLKLLGRPFNDSIPNERVATRDNIKQRHFPRNISLLSDQTLQGICRFVALDYYLFDFEPPYSCQKELFANVADIMGP